MGSITKNHLLSLFASRCPRLSEKAAVRAASIIIDTMQEQLIRGGRIEIRNFGSFDLKVRKGRLGRNPQDGSMVEVKARVLAFFLAGQGLRDRVDATRGVIPFKPSKSSEAAPEGDAA